MTDAAAPAPPSATSPALDQIAPALVAALGQLTELKRGRTAKVEMKGGGSYSYKYADLSDAMTEVRPVLAQHGLVVSQSIGADGPRLVVRTILLHTSGQMLVSDGLPMTATGTPQAIGSAITYARRYSLLAALGIATEDDEGQRAAAGVGQRPRSTTTGGTTRSRGSTSGRNATDGPTRAQTAKAMAEFGEAGVVDRGARLAMTSAIIGRDVASWNDVSRDEATRVIDLLVERRTAGDQAIAAAADPDTAPDPDDDRAVDPEGSTPGEAQLDLGADDDADAAWIEQARGGD